MIAVPAAVSALVRPATQYAVSRELLFARKPDALESVPTARSQGGQTGGKSWSGESDANAIWRLALTSGAGLVLVVSHQGSLGTECQEASAEGDEGDAKIAKLSEQKQNGTQSSWMVKFEVFASRDLSCSYHTHA